MYSRGRSKDVSPVALARQASDERRRNSTSIMSHYPLPTDPARRTCSPFFVPATSASPSPAATPFTLTPPDPAPLPSRHRTRIIHIDDSYAPIDPQKSSSIAQVIHVEPLHHSVRPHLSFSLPSDTLGEKPAFQVQRARDRARAKCRYETLARAEQVFATILARSRRERLAVLVLRSTHQEDGLKERTRDQERPERERDQRGPTNNASHADRSSRVLTHATHSTPAFQQRPATDRFTYAFPIPSTSSSANSAPVRQQQGGIKSRLGLATMTNPKATNTRSISFDDIRGSMGGVLFPTTPGDSVTPKTRRESELLGTLLEAVRWEEGERWQQNCRVKASAALLPEIASECGACASASLPHTNGLSLSPSSQALSLPSGGLASTSASTASRPVSWLSFGSRKSTPSINTAQTTPLSATKELPSFTDRPTPQRSCGCVRGHSLMIVDVNDTPLGSTVEPSPTPAPFVAILNTSQGPSHQRSRKTSRSMRTWLASSVTSFLTAASRVQQAYVSATMATLVSTDYPPHRQMLSVSSADEPSDYSKRPPCGWRAQRSDVAKFASGTLSADWVAVPYLVFHLENMPRLPPPVAESPINGQTQNSTMIPPAYHNADRHIFNANRLHLLSRAQINSWRFRGAPGATPRRVSYRPELFYRLEPGGGSSRGVRGGSALKRGWHVVWETEGNVGQ